MEEKKVPALEEAAQMASRNFGRVFEAQTLWLESLNSLLASTPAASVEPDGPANQDMPAKAPQEVREMAGEEDIYLA
jgi:hypothetical protein